MNRKIYGQAAPCPKCGHVGPLLNEPCPRCTALAAAKEIESILMNDALPEEYQPLQCRPLDQQPRPLGYGVGFKKGAEIGMVAGPVPNVRRMLELDPTDEDLPSDHQAVIIRFNPDDTDDILSRWHKEKQLWQMNPKFRKSQTTPPQNTTDASDKQ